MTSTKSHRYIDDSGLNKEFYDRLIFDYAPLVSRIAKRLHNKLPKHIELDDLTSAGVLGLVDAIKRFDPAFNNSFKTYAEYRIKGAMLDYLREWDCLPRSVRDLEKQIQNSRKKLESACGQCPTRSKIAKDLNITESQIEQHELILYSTPLQLKSSSFSEKIANEADKDSPSILLELIENETYKTLKQAIALLPEQMQNVLKLYYFDNLSLKMIATLLNVTESRVSQIHREAIETLRKRAIKAF